MTAGPMASRFSIAHVTPYPWEDRENEVNAYVEGVARELSARGHRVLILAPSRSQERVRDSRKALRAARSALREARTRSCEREGASTSTRWPRADSSRVTRAT